jgi:hypothetical protein
MSTPQDRLYDPFFAAATKLYDLPENLLRNMAKIESNFNPEAVGPVTRSGESAVGLMQIMPSMHPDIDPTDPYESIDYAGKYLRELYDQFGSWELALAGYNAGPGTVNRFGRTPPSEWQGYEETKNYVNRLLENTQNVPDGPMEEDAFSRWWNEGGERSFPNIHPEDSPGYRELGPGLHDLPFIGKYIRGAIEKVAGPIPEEIRDLEPKGSPGPLEWLAPMRGGVNVVAGAAKLARRLSPFRRSGARLAGEVAKASGRTTRAGAPSVSRATGTINRDFLGREVVEIGTRAADDAARMIFDDGYKFWKEGLGGMNPSQIDTHIRSLTEAERLISQRGKLLALREHLANMGRLTEQAQRQLMSPAGQARLAETFRGMPPEYVQHFNKLVEAGQYQRVTRFAFLAGIAFQAARRYGRGILEFVGIDR